MLDRRVTRIPNPYQQVFYLTLHTSRADVGIQYLLTVFAVVAIIVGLPPRCLESKPRVESPKNAHPPLSVRSPGSH